MASRRFTVILQYAFIQRWICSKPAANDASFSSPPLAVHSSLTPTDAGIAVIFTALVDVTITPRMSEQKGDVVCEECDRKTQKELPAASTSSEGMPCQEAYSAVTKCMAKHNGQISPCVKEWDVFKACHEKRNATK